MVTLQYKESQVAANVEEVSGHTDDNKCLGACTEVI
jgi:hypothetical protein